MLRPPVPSSGKRFLSKLGIALVWAVCLGGLLGALVYFRVPRAEPEFEEPWHQRLRRGLEEGELKTYDWRVAALGQVSVRSDQVVPVTIDDESLASAREDASMGLGGHPWPREVLGQLSEEVMNEGGALVLFDLALAEASVRSCGVAGASDDEAFRASLERTPGQSVLPFAFSTRAARPPGRELKPYLLRVGIRDSFEDAHGLLRQVFAERAPAYLMPDGQKVVVWAGAASEPLARGLADALRIAPGRVMRERGSADADHEVTPSALLASLAQVTVEGLDPDRVPRARSLTPPLASLLTGASRYGFVGGGKDADGVVRGFSHFVAYVTPAGRRYLLPSAVVAAAMRAAGSSKLRYSEGALHIGDKFHLPMDATGYSLVRFDTAEGSATKGSLKRSVPAWRLLINRADHAVARGAVHHANDLEERLAIVTDTSSYAPEGWKTPIGPTPASAVLGQSLVNVLRSEGIRRTRPDQDFLLAVLGACLGALLAVAFSATFKARAGPLAYLLTLAIFCGIYVVFARAVFVADQLWLPIAAPLTAMSATFLAATGYAATLERRLREFVTSALGRSVSPEVARRVRQDLRLIRPERREVTVYRADLVGFARLVERLKPDEVVSLLQECFSLMSEQVTQSRGQVDQTAGDALTAFWGAPIPLASHAAAACECALRLREALESRQQSFQQRFGRRLTFRAGVGTGVGVAGDMGSDRQSNYSVVGPPMTLATVLEAANRQYGTSVLVSEPTRLAAGDAFLFREIDRRVLYGKGPPAPIFELVGRSAGMAEPVLQLLWVYERGLTAYHERRFAEALELFTKGAARHDDAVCRLYASRCRHFAVDPPPLAWNGQYEGP